MQLKKRLSWGLLLFTFATIAMERSGPFFSSEESHKLEDMWGKKENPNEQQAQKKHGAFNIFQYSTPKEAQSYLKYSAGENPKFKITCPICNRKMYRNSKQAEKSQIKSALLMHVKRKHIDINIETVIDFIDFALRMNANKRKRKSKALSNVQLEIAGPFTLQETPQYYRAWCSLCNGKELGQDRKNTSRSHFIRRLITHLSDVHGKKDRKYLDKFKKKCQGYFEVYKRKNKRISVKN